jgi:hypothetical protein
MTGRKCGRLYVLGRADMGGKKGIKRGQWVWHCRCDCGNEAVVPGFELRTGQIRSCGCLLKEATTKHGMSGTPEFFIWWGMQDRCMRTTTAYYDRYGGRGISVCKEWRDSFAAFYRDMGPRPSPKHSLDRVNNDGNYEPGNCRWATKKEQAANRGPRRRNLNVVRLSEALEGCLRWMTGAGGLPAHDPTVAAARLALKATAFRRRKSQCRAPLTQRLNQLSEEAR